jgi:hypothetical protein
MFNRSFIFLRYLVFFLICKCRNLEKNKTELKSATHISEITEIAQKNHKYLQRDSLPGSGQIKNLNLREKSAQNNK